MSCECSYCQKMRPYDNARVTCNWLAASFGTVPGAWQLVGVLVFDMKPAPLWMTLASLGAALVFAGVGWVLARFLLRELRKRMAGQPQQLGEALIEAFRRAAADYGFNAADLMRAWLRDQAAEEQHRGAKSQT